jgi:hypothetical protein
MKEAMKLALDYLNDHQMGDHVRAALEEALAKQEQGEPVAYIGKNQFERLKDYGLVTTSLTLHKAFEDDIAFYTTPQQSICLEAESTLKEGDI